jgi:phage gp45-like
MGVHFPANTTLTMAISEAQKLSKIADGGEVIIYMEGAQMSHKMVVVKKGEVKFL